MQVHHSLLQQNNTPANHIAQFMSRAGQFLCWYRNFYQKKNLYQIDRHTSKFLVPDDLHNFLV